MSIIAALMSAALAAAGPPTATPLFADDATIAVSIQGPLGEIARSAERSSTPRDGTLTFAAAGETLPIRLSPRGITRRRSETCSFPPLRVEFPQKPAAASLFAGQRRLKLVTHCRPAESFQQYLLLEYSAYRLFNLLSPVGFRVRLASIDYAEPDGRKRTQRLGFFIEDLDDIARRNGLADAKVGLKIPAAQLDPRYAARVALFEYMVSNIDWSMHAGPVGDECCHNIRLLTAVAGRPPYIPVAYDFDYSGLVNAPYAVPPEGIRADDVRQRIYRGYCRDNGQALIAAAEFRAKRPELEAVYSRIPEMSARTRGKALSYLLGFFNDIASDETMRTKLFKTCIGG